MHFSFLALIPLFAFSSFNLQWFLWLIPFLIYFYLDQPMLKTVIIFLCIGFFGLVFLSQVSLNLGMLAPLEPTLLTLDWPLKQILGEENIFNFMNITHTFLAACLICLSGQS